MAFPARYNFKCSKCNKFGKRGEMISWSRKNKGVIYHEKCRPEMVVIANSQTKLQLDETENITYKLEEKKMESNDNKALEVFAEALAPLVQNKLKSVLDESMIKALINDTVGKLIKPRTIEIKKENDTKVSQIENPHNMIPRLLYYINKRHHVYLYGPAGGGKSTAAQQIAEALNLSFGYLSLNPQTPDSRLLGFIDAGGTYRPTPFYNCYKEGGVFCIDEMDNASAALLTTLNSMLENGCGAFPCGLVKRHKDFVLVATGNTNGKGGNPMFPERRPFDTAFSERFTFMFWDYDTDMERKVTLLINPKAEKWLNWVWKARDYVVKNFPRVLISPRAAFKGAEYLKDNTLSPKEIVEALIFKGLDKDSVEKILRDNPLDELKK